MTVTLTPATLVSWRQERGTPTQEIYLTGLIEIDGNSLRLVDPDRDECKIDIVDPRFCKTEVIEQWPIHPSIQCGLCALHGGVC